MKYEGLLPIGSVVNLQNVENQPVMIMGYCVRKANQPARLFDYCGCPHPSGALAPDQTLLFNHAQIQKVLSVGYISETSYVFIPKMEQILAELRQKNVKKEGEPNET